jgi:hypothetical protein
VHRVARKRSTGSTSFAGGMELPVLHIAISRGFSSNVLLIRMTPLSHRRFSAARVVNQHAVHEARSKVATAVPNVFATTDFVSRVVGTATGAEKARPKTLSSPAQKIALTRPVPKNKRAAEGAPSLTHQSRQSRESADEG